jgi:Fe-Mn family superoxide dismutase
MTRRESIGAFGLGGAYMMSSGRQAGGSSAKQEQSAAAAYAGKHEVQALPFDPKSLRGISEKLIVSPHHENNYGAARSEPVQGGGRSARGHEGYATPSSWPA